MKRVPTPGDVDRARKGDRAAQARVLKDMGAIIGLFARRFASSRRVEVDDLEQIGALAVFDALRTFNPKKKRAFHWHATQWIRSRLGYAVGRERGRNEVSAETVVAGNDGAEYTLGDHFESRDAPVDEVFAHAQLLRKMHDRITATQEPAHRAILQRRAAGADYASIGRAVGYSRERVRQIIRVHVAALSSTLPREVA